MENLLLGGFPNAKINREEVLSKTNYVDSKKFRKNKQKPCGFL